MPNLVGIGNSQVPINAMLGGLAYQDSVGEIHIEKIKARTSDTATDIFVYDTRKDSDGGAWRHRTQKTSWYNEAVSATRGARKEFPAVAVIVAKTDTLTIYDGDDPNLSMWMIFEANTDSQDLFINDSSSSLTSVAALNGRVFAGSTRTSTTGNITGIDFIGDRGGMVYTSSSDIRTYGGGVGQRNDGLGNNASTSNWFTSGTIVNRNVNDVAMTVLPNAPIDASTGLPVPTIALATDGGVSVIRDNGTVDSDSSIYGRPFVTQIKFKGERLTGLVHQTGNTGDGVLFIEPLNEVPFPEGTDTRYPMFVSSDSALSLDAVDTKGTHPIEVASKNVIAGGNQGIGIIEEKKDSPTNGIIAHIAKDFNTGYQHGDIKGAFLSDTDDTNITADSELITNGTFDSNTTGWTAGNSTLSQGSGQMTITRSGGSGTTCYQDITTVVGQKYMMSAKINSSGSRGDLRAHSASAFGGSLILNLSGTNGQTVGVLGTFTATSTTTSIGFAVDNNSTSIIVDNVSMIAVQEEDRSINDKGLQVFGTVTKSTVAAGAELVAYSGFSNSNYLLQPYNSDLDFTDTMSIMLWVNGWVGSDSLLHRGPGTDRNEKTSFHLYCSYDHNYRLTLCSTTLNGDGDTVEQTFEIPLSGSLIGWQHLCFTLSNGNVRGFLNGVEKTLSSNSFTGTNIFSQATHQNGLYIGTGPVSGPAATASLALLRLSATTPSADQIKKIYDDEKCLFQKNSKATLYGTSNNITGLAYDDSNNVVHAGTSSGRSEFQGLNRINNTTTAVTTEISASDGLVAEQ